MAAPVYYTAEMVRKLPEDGNRYETVHGELLVTPAPRMWHQLVLERLRDALKVYLVRHPEWFILSAPADISPGPDVLVQPDLFVVPLQEARTLDWARLSHLELVVEVLSDTTARADRFAKRWLYQDMGVPTYWIVDADAKCIEQYLLKVDRYDLAAKKDDGVILSRTIVALEIPVVAAFASAW